jgi:hypothetical protein
VRDITSDTGCFQSRGSGQLAAADDSSLLVGSLLPSDAVGGLGRMRWATEAGEELR